jgi:hypothetical protein
VHVRTGAVRLGGGTSVIASLVINEGATVDIADNALVIDYAATSPADMVRERIVSGRGGAGLGKVWNGTGITSSTAAAVNAGAPDSRSVGYAENALLPLGAYTDFRGQAVDATSVLIAYTRTGDANLDGVVNNDDVAVLGANYSPGAAKPAGSAWALGDFDYNGFVDNDDVMLLGAFYQTGAAPPPPTTKDEGQRTKDEGGITSYELRMTTDGVQSLGGAVVTFGRAPQAAGSLAEPMAHAPAQDIRVGRTLAEYPLPGPLPGRERRFMETLDTHGTRLLDKPAVAPNGDETFLRDGGLVDLLAEAIAADAARGRQLLYARGPEFIGWPNFFQP